MRNHVKTVVLHKTSNTALTIRMVGEPYTTTFRTFEVEGEAQRLAFRMLKRDYPNENPMDWDIKEIIYAHD